MISNRGHSRQTAFTLIELLVVISIISILSSVVLSSLNSAREEAAAAAKVNEGRALVLALEQYRFVEGSYPSLPMSDYSTGSGSIKTAYVGCSDDSQNTANLVSALSPYIKNFSTNNVLGSDCFSYVRGDDIKPGGVSWDEEVYYVLWTNRVMASDIRGSNNPCTVSPNSGMLADVDYPGYELYCWSSKK